MERRTIRLSPAALAMLVLGIFLGTIFLERFNLLPGSASAPLSVGRTFSPFWEAWNLVEEHYVDRGAVKSQAMTAGAIEGMLDSLGDIGHTSYLPRDEVEKFESDLEGKLEGIGATVILRKDLPTVLRIVPDSPAKKAGLKPGDVFHTVNGKAVAGLPLDRVIGLLRGPAGTKLKLRVLGDGDAEPRDIEITLAKIDIPFVTWAMLPGETIAHVLLREFGENSDAQLRTALQEARAQGARGIIFDVRGNPGGIKDQAIRVTSEFLASGDVMIEKDSAGEKTAIPVIPGGTAATLPMIVLIDEGSASSSEIFAGAIQDHQRAKIVGTKSVGTGTVLQQFNLSDGSAVLLAVLEWYTPKGRQIWHKGIEPDKTVKLGEDAALLEPEDVSEMSAGQLRRSRDYQLLLALDMLRQEIRKGKAG